MDRPEPTMVAVARASAAAYPEAAPFNPSTAYPEYEFGDIGSEPNHVYDAVRRAFAVAGLDNSRVGTTQWNPLGGLISPGEVVLLKPNLIKEAHPRDASGWRYVLTHGSIIRAVADYVWKALGRQGRILIADAPQTDSSFETIVRVLGLDRIRDFYIDRGLTLELIDLRREEWENRGGVIVARRKLAGDPYGCVAFDLGEKSEFCGHEGGGRYYGAFYDEGEVNRHHTEGRHEYLIARVALDADVIFSLPKLKTHKKAGITVSLKNLVGVNGDKNWLPHHTTGTPADGGDEFPSASLRRHVERTAARSFRQLVLAAPKVGPWLMRQARPIGLSMFGDTEEVVRSGNWAGNDTTWRMCLDLNKIIMYGNPDGSLREGLRDLRKRHFALVDGILAGEGRGPMNPDPVEAGIVLFGLHPASVDAAAAWLMGFDPERLPIVRQAFRCRALPLAEWDWRDVHLVSDRSEWNGPLPDVPDASTFHFTPHFGWTSAIERR